MNPFDVLLKTLETDRQTGAFIFGGLGLFAAIAIAFSFGIDRDTAFLMAAYFIGLTILLLLAVHIVSDPQIKRVLAWFLTSVFIIIVLALLFASFVQDQRILNPPYCLVQFWRKCTVVEEAIADRTTSQVVQNSKAIPAPPRDVRAASYQVFVQFAGIIKRDDVQSMMKKLRDLGWNIQGIDRGGERTTAAAGLNVVRYGSPEDADAAAALAAAVQEISPSNAKIATEVSNGIKSKSLEVWISR